VDTGQDVVANPAVVSLVVGLLALAFATPAVWRNLWYLIITPFFSVRANAEEDHGMFTVLMLVGGGYLFNSALAYVMPRINDHMSSVWQAMAQARVTSPTDVYIETAREAAVSELLAKVFPGPIETILTLVPVILILLWLIINLIFWLFSKIFQNPTDIGTYYQILAYPMFLTFISLGFFLLGYWMMESGPIGLVFYGLGALVGLWAFIIAIFAYYQALQLSPVMFVIVMIVGLGLWGTAAYYGYQAWVTQPVSEILGRWNSYHPERV